MQQESKLSEKMMMRTLIKEKMIPDPTNNQI